MVLNDLSYLIGNISWVCSSKRVILVTIAFIHSVSNAKAFIFSIFSGYGTTANRLISVGTNEIRLSIIKSIIPTSVVWQFCHITIKLAMKGLLTNANRLTRVSMNEIRLFVFKSIKLPLLDNFVTCQTSNKITITNIIRLTCVGTNEIRLPKFQCVKVWKEWTATYLRQPRSCCDSLCTVL